MRLPWNWGWLKGGMNHIARRCALFHTGGWCQNTTLSHIDLPEQHLNLAHYSKLFAQASTIGIAVGPFNVAKHQTANPGILAGLGKRGGRSRQMEATIPC